MSDVTPIDIPADDDATTEPGQSSVGARITVAILLGFFYAYLVWQGIGNLVNLPAYFLERYGVATADAPWAILIAGVAAPVLVFAAAMWAGWRRSASMLALVLTAGFGLSALISLDLLAIVKQVEVQMVIEFLGTL